MAVFDRPTSKTKQLDRSVGGTIVSAGELRMRAAIGQDQAPALAEWGGGHAFTSAAENLRLLGDTASRAGAPGDSVELANAAAAGQIALADLYPDLAAGLSAAELQSVRTTLRVPLVCVEVGRCELGSCADAAHARRPLLGAVVVEGLLIDETWLGGQVSAQIFGPGDLLNADRQQEGALATVRTLLAPAPATLGVLDEHFLFAARRWPLLAAQFFSQAMRQADRASEQKAISQLPRVEERLLTLFWHLADRYGRVGVEGVLIDLPLTHEIIGRLIGARRPTVTLGLTELANQGLLRRTTSGEWLLIRERHDGRGAAPPGDGKPHALTRGESSARTVAV